MAGGAMVATEFNTVAQNWALGCGAGGDPDRDDQWERWRCSPCWGLAISRRSARARRTDHAARPTEGFGESAVRALRGGRRLAGADATVSAWPCASGAIVVYRVSCSCADPGDRHRTRSTSDGRPLTFGAARAGRPGCRNQDLDPTILDAVKTSIAGRGGDRAHRDRARVARGHRPGRAQGPSGRPPFLALVFLILVTPEIVVAIGAPHLVRAYRRSVRAGRDDPRGAGFGMLRLWVGHSLARDGGRRADRARARLAGLEEALGGGGRGSLRDTVASFPPDHAPARCCRQCSQARLLVQLQPGRHDHLVVRECGRRFAVASLRVQCGAERAADPRSHPCRRYCYCLTLFAITCVALVLRRTGQSGEEVAKTMTVGG